MPPPAAALTSSKPAAPPRTRTEALRLQIADEIVSGVLEPGTPLDEQELAARFGVSRTPVREAIRQLSASGSSASGRIAARSSPCRRRPSSTTCSRRWPSLKALCAGLAARNMTVPERRGLEALHQALARARA
jgi:DNA-binding transcriptional MocR family regulator